MNKNDDGDGERVLGYWRSISAEAFDDSMKSEVIEFVRATTSTIPTWQRAISGGAEAAIGMVAHCEAPTSISLKIDFPMTVSLSCAFEYPGAARTLSDKLHRMPIEPRLRARLVASWQAASLLLSLRRPALGPHATDI